MQQEIIDMIRGKEVNVTAAYQALCPQIQAHCENVARIGRQLFLWAAEAYPDEFIPEIPHQDLYDAIRWHDIGLVFIPQRLLCKKDDLTGAEQRVVQQHASYGSSLLNNYRKSHVDSIQQHRFWLLASEIAIGHHERWDGKGYPFGLLATAVSPLARVVAVADAYDSMTRGSSYRMALPPEYALLEIVHHADLQFDPKLTALFNKNFDAILALTPIGGD